MFDCIGKFYLEYGALVPVVLKTICSIPVVTFFGTPVHFFFRLWEDTLPIDLGKSFQI